MVDTQLNQIKEQKSRGLNQKTLVKSDDIGFNFKNHQAFQIIKGKQQQKAQDKAKQSKDSYHDNDEHQRRGKLNKSIEEQREALSALYHEPTLPKHKRSVAYAKSDYHYDSRSSRYCYDTRKEGTKQLQSQKSIPDILKVQLH